MPDEQIIAFNDSNLKHHIAEHGWAIQYVGGKCTIPRCTEEHDPFEIPYGYTIGLTRYHGHPEVAMVDAPIAVTATMLNRIGAQVRQGRRFAAGDAVPMNPPYVGRLVEIGNSARNLGYANRLYRNEGGPPIPALQLVWPDRDGLMPWHLRTNRQPLWGWPPAGEDTSAR